MKTPYAAFLIFLFSSTTSVRANDQELPADLDPIYFLAGISVEGNSLKSIQPPQCEAFFKDSGERRTAEAFLAATKVWNQHFPATASPTKYYYQEGGHRLVVENPNLAKALQRFYEPTVNTSQAKLIQMFTETTRDQRLAFVAGVYIRCCRNGVFHGFPSPAMCDAVIIFLSEGCEVSNLSLSEQEVPNTIHFKVKPSERVARIFSAIDNWQTPQVDWKPVE